MTYVGKILVILILAFSIFFLASAVTVFTASTNWREAYQKASTKNTELQQTVTTTQQQAASLKTQLETELGARKTDIDTLKGTMTNLETERDRLQNEVTKARSELETAQQSAKAFIEQAQQRTKETEVLRENLLAVQKQADDYKIQQTELNDQIRGLERQLNIATENNKQLRENLAAFQSYLQGRGLPSDPEQVKLASGNTVVAPQVEGKVLAVNGTNEIIEISIGSDDGLAAGQEFYVFRTGVAPEFVGKIRITSTEADSAVGRVVSRYLGRKVMEGDNVSSQIQPRS